MAGENLPRLYNRWLQIGAYYNRELQTSAAPELFQVEPTNYCNLKCPMCPHDLMTREVGFMDLALYRSVVQQVRRYSASVRLHNMGESLLHRQISEFISYAKENGLTTILSSNASALTRRASERIIDAGLDELLISFDGVSKEIYEFCRAGANYNNVLANIDQFLQLRERRRTSSPKVTMSLIDMPLTKGEISEFIRRWSPKVDNVRIKPPRNWDGSSNRINELVSIPGQHSSGYPCSRLWTSLVVLWDGRVVPCCMDFDAKVVLGNMKEKTLAEIFNDRPMQALRAVHANAEVCKSDLCRGCSSPTRIQGHWLPLAGLSYRAITRFAQLWTAGA